MSKLNFKAVSSLFRKLTVIRGFDIFIYSVAFIFGVIYLPFFITAIVFRLMYRILIYPIRQKNAEMNVYGKLQEKCNLV
jgi:hypothetical protein